MESGVHEFTRAAKLFNIVILSRPESRTPDEDG